MLNKLPCTAFSSNERPNKCHATGISRASAINVSKHDLDLALVVKQNKMASSEDSRGSSEDSYRQLSDDESSDEYSSDESR